MTPPDPSSSEREPLERLAEEFLERARRGEAPSVEAYAAANPDLAGEIRSLFPTLTRVEAAPFTVTALASAIEMIEAPEIMQVREPTLVPMLGIVNSESGEELEMEIGSLLERGFRTFKIKVGFDVDKDVRKLAEIQRRVAGRAMLRVDGNQGYNRDDALRFVKQIDPAGIELLEQPCAASDWEAAVAVAAVATVPMMLDESIYGVADIARAADLGAARYIKLKLMKLGTLERLASALDLIRARGMEPVLGNGVACEPGCWMEALVARLKIANAGEMNGFLKPVAPLLREPLAFSEGAISLQPGFAPVLDEKAVQRFRLGEARFK